MIRPGVIVELSTKGPFDTPNRSLIINSIPYTKVAQLLGFSGSAWLFDAVQAQGS